LSELCSVKLQNVQLSDTTEDDSSNAANYKNLINELIVRITLIVANPRQTTLALLLIVLYYRTKIV